MANANIKYLTDENKNVVSPVTSSKSVFLTDNTALQDKINSVDNNISTINSKLINATTSAAGFMSAEDKAKLDGIATGADNVSVTRNLTSGTKVGTITINGTGTDLYAPAANNMYIQSQKVSVSRESWTDGEMTSNSVTFSKSGYWPIYLGCGNWSPTGSTIFRSCGPDQNTYSSGTMSIKLTVKGNNVTPSTKGGSVTAYVGWLPLANV